jgi:predicted ATPase
MLTQIKLTHFKCFKEETSFPLSQLNLLTGINGRGKSTLLQSLLLMRQSVEHNEKNTTQILLNGRCVNLGNFNDIRNSSTSRKESIIFEYDFSQEKLNTKYYLVENSEDHKSANIDKTKSVQNNYFDFSKIHYISADRFGPQEFYLKSNLTTFYNVGTKGELTANILNKKKDDLVNDKLCLGEDAKTLSSQTEAWLSQIFDGAKVEIPHSETNILELFLNTSASRDRFKAVNVGFGYSYILPIIVSGLIAKKGEILIVENPEAHLHPKAQSRLTQFLAKISRCGVQVFIESHSEHILNALRIAVLDKIVTPEGLSILYFQQSEQQPVAIQIPMKVNGGIEEWPEGFFDQMDKDFERIFGV